MKCIFHRPVFVRKSALNRTTLCLVYSSKNVFAWNKFLNKEAEEQMIVHCHVPSKPILRFKMIVEETRRIVYLSQKNQRPWNKGRELRQRKPPSRRFFRQGNTNRSKASSEDQETTGKRSFVRLSAGDHALVTRPSLDCQSYITPDCDGESGSSCILRPRSESCRYLQNANSNEYEGGQRVVSEEKMIDMMTSTAHIHQTTSSTCPMPNFAVLEARKLGISWKYKIKCANCPFTSPTFNLYHEIHQEGPGRNPSATNIALAYAIQNTAIGAEKIIELLTCLDIPAPSKSFMQTLLCKTSRKMTELNKLDMNDKIQKVKEVNVTRGHPENIINISTDARYNSSVMFSRKTPGQNASQAFSLAVETNTDRKYILACAVQNKLCWTVHGCAAKAWRWTVLAVMRNVLQTCLRLLRSRNTRWERISALSSACKMF